MHLDAREALVHFATVLHWTFIGWLGGLKVMEKCLHIKVKWHYLSLEAERSRWVSFILPSHHQYTPYYFTNHRIMWPITLPTTAYHSPPKLCDMGMLTILHSRLLHKPHPASCHQMGRVWVVTNGYFTTLSWDQPYVAFSQMSCLHQWAAEWECWLMIAHATNKSLIPLRPAVALTQHLWTGKMDRSVVMKFNSGKCIA